MKFVFGLAVLSLTQVGLASAPKVIYGKDDRVEVYEASLAHQKLAQSAVTMVSKENIIPDERMSGVFHLTQKTFRSYLEESLAETIKEKNLPKITFCDGTKFVDQPAAGMCSGSLIGPDLIMTAGHCVTEDSPCEDFDWVFDYTVDKETQKAGFNIPKDNIYHCKKVIRAVLDFHTGADFAIVQLDRRVRNRLPVEVRTSGDVEDKAEVFVIGNPSGLPTKVTTGGIVRDNSESAFFDTNLDTFQGNSGSAVFNAKTGVVEGILVRGEEDFDFNYLKMCVDVKICKEDECRGESVTRVNYIPEVALMPYFEKAIIENNDKLLTRLLELPSWVDFYLKDGKTPLIKASAQARSLMMAKLIQAKADVNHQDADGNTALHHLAKVLNKKNQEALKVLIEAQANTRILNNKGESPRDVALRNGNFYGALKLHRARSKK